MLPLLDGIDDGSGSGAAGGMMEDAVPFLLSMNTHCCGDDESSSPPPSSFFFFISAALVALSI